MKTNLSYTRLVKVFSVYGLALVAAVACGENFEPRQGQVDLSPTATGAAASGQFQPMIASVEKYEIREAVGSSYELTFNIVDGSKAIPNQRTYHYGAESSFDTTKEVDSRYKYQIEAFCKDEDCNFVGVVIVRTDYNNNSKLQSSFYIRDNGSSFKTEISEHGSAYANSEHAYNTLSKRSVRPGGF